MSGVLGGGIDVLVSEVGPRDGLQSISVVMSTADKKAWIDALAAAGVREIEVGSFVPAKVLPQLADTDQIVAHARAIPGVTVAVLVPNLKGAERALQAGVHKITIPISVSESHSLRNVRRSHVQMIDEVSAIASLVSGVPRESRPSFEVGLSTAFGCTIEGPVPQRKVVELAEMAMQAGADEVGLSDTTGYGNPAEVRSLTKAVWSAIGREHLSGIHLHNTRGQGLANVVAALDVGLTTVDASLCGLGGCPFAPGASGNIVTEDLVFLLEAMGLRTGIDIGRLIEARAVLERSLTGQALYGFVACAGLPLGFVPASARSEAEASSIGG